MFSIRHGYVASVLLASILAGCQYSDSSVAPSSGDPGARTAQPRTGDPGTTPSAAQAPAADRATTAAVDSATTGLQLRIPKESLKALADPDYRNQRLAMVRTQISAGGVFDGREPIRDNRVLEAMRQVPRHEFVPRRMRRYAHYDQPLAIGYGQTISQPYIVALMTERLQPKAEHRVLEVGTGSGYQAAVLGLLVKEVYTIEIVDALAKRATRDLERLGYRNVFTRSGDGYRGWPEKAPFDGIIVTAAPEKIPEPLMEQLKLGGRLVLPVGPQWGNQELVVIRKTERGPFRETIIPVRFVPMTGEIQKRSEP